MKRKFRNRLKDPKARKALRFAQANAVAPAPQAKKNPLVALPEGLNKNGEEISDAKITNAILKIEDPASRRRAIKHLPIEIMIAKGKDELEAALFFVVDELVEDARYQWGSGWKSPEQEAKEARRNDLYAIFSYVEKRFIHAYHERAYFYHPHVAALALRHHKLTVDFVESHEKIYDKLGRRCRLLDQLDSEKDELERIERELALVTGFAVGIRAAQEALGDNLKEMNLKQFERFTVAASAETKLGTKEER